MRERIERLEDKISDLESKMDILEEKMGGVESNPQGSLEHFVEQVNPETHQQCALAIGYYFDKIEGRKFSFNDISNGFQRSRWTKYSNMSMLKNKLVKEKEWFMEVGEDEKGKTTYQLTKKGIQLVEDEVEE